MNAEWCYTDLSNFILIYKIAFSQIEIVSCMDIFTKNIRSSSKERNSVENIEIK